jgi:DNA (cytosine-5)-methyltransferase 1
VKTNYLDAFSGIGGFALGAYSAGFRCENHFFSEIEPYAIALYGKRFPDSIPLGSILDIDYEKLKKENKGQWVFTGGFPCQPHSVAGNKKASEDERDLWGECKRMLRELRPRFAIFENVPGLFVSEQGRFFNRVLADISEVGYDCEWGVIPASFFGAPHKRDRIWLVAYPTKKRWDVSVNKKKNNNTFGELSHRVKPGARWRRKDGGHSLESVGWIPEPELRGGNDGIPTELDVDRISALGNAVVPQIPEVIFRLIIPHLAANR